MPDLDPTKKQQYEELVAWNRLLDGKVSRDSPLRQRAHV
jgi:hypothetical protein